MVSGSVDNTAVMWDINKGLIRLRYLSIPYIFSYVTFHLLYLLSALLMQFYNSL